MVFGRWRKSAGGAPPPASSATSPGVDLPRLLGVLLARLPQLESATADIAVSQARLADRIRDLGWVPPRPGAPVLSGLVDEGARRFSVAVWIFRLVDDELLAQLPQRNELDALVHALATVAMERDLLTIALMRQSTVRLEEFTRATLSALSVGINGESLEESVAALERLDYARLLEDAGLAKASAEERAAWLRKLQEKATPIRRGKF